MTYKDAVTLVTLDTDERILRAHARTRGREIQGAENKVTKVTFVTRGYRLEGS